MRRNYKSPQFILRVVVGVLLAANLVAAGLLLFPPGGSAEDLEKELASLQAQAATKKALLEKTRQNVAAVELGRAEGDQFLSQYFLGRRAAPETLLAGLGKAAEGSKIKGKETSWTIEPIDGSDTLSMLSIVASYEGEYGDLLHFVHEIDQAPSLLIIESLSAAPQAGSKILSIALKLDTFVREDGLVPDPKPAQPVAMTAVIPPKEMK
jgi:type IV pilus assembly protein PilO